MKVREAGGGGPCAPPFMFPMVLYGAATDGAADRNDRQLKIAQKERGEIQYRAT